MMQGRPSPRIVYAPSPPGGVAATREQPATTTRRVEPDRGRARTSRTNIINDDRAVKKMTVRLFRHLLREWSMRVDHGRDLSWRSWRTLAEAHRVGILHRAHASASARIETATVTYAPCDFSCAQSRLLRLAVHQISSVAAPRGATQSRISHETLAWRVGVIFLLHTLFETQPVPRQRVRLCASSGAALLRLRADLFVFYAPETTDGANELNELEDLDGWLPRRLVMRMVDDALFILDRMVCRGCFSFGEHARPVPPWAT